MKVKSWNAKHLRKWMRKGRCPGCDVGCNSYHKAGCTTRKEMLASIGAELQPMLTQSYRLGLLRHTKELVAMSKAIKFNHPSADVEFIRNWQMFMSKLNFLVGYIQALEE